jgi:hypothetical protein
MPHPLVTLILGTYWAQRTACRRSWPNTAAHPAGTKITKAWVEGGREKLVGGGQGRADA